MSSFRPRPGCGGLFIGMTALSVVIDQVDAGGLAVLETKDDAPVGAHDYGPQTLQVAFQAMQSKAWPVHGVDGRSSIEGGEYHGNALDHIRRQPAWVILLVEPPQAFVPDTFDHRRLL